MVREGVWPTKVTRVGLLRVKEVVVWETKMVLGVWGRGSAIVVGTTLLRELVLLEMCQPDGLDQGQRLENLDLAANIEVQTRDEATQEERWRKINYPICLSFKLMQILTHRTCLG